MHCTGRNNRWKTKRIPSKNDVFYLVNIFGLYPGLKLLFEHNRARKNQFSSAGFCCDSRFSIREMEQKFDFGGTIGFGDSYLESFFRHFKVFSLHAKLHDAAAKALKAHNGRGPGYCYVIGRGPNWCLLHHVTGLLFCVYVKRFLPSFFDSVDFWSSMSCIELDF